MSKGKKKGSQENFWQRMDVRSRMFFVLALCSGAILLTVVGTFLAVHGTLKEETAGDDSSVVTESDYDQNENAIDTAQYASTILEESEDAGEEYIDETLFLGDSNTARMRLYGYISYDNSVASVGMAARSIESYACAKFSGYSSYKTMPEAVALMQPRRVLITFGTNDVSSSLTAEKFIENYESGIKAVQEAYPSVDIIINSIPPIGKQHSNSDMSQSQIDAYNKAIVQMCEENGWKYLNSAEVLKGSDGYAKSGYVDSDGIHLTRTALDALFEYIRTHSYITEDDRPTLKDVPKHTEDKDVSASTASSVLATPTPAASSSSEEEESSSQSSSSQSSSSQSSSSSQTYTYWDETIAPTCSEQGYTIHHCNEDSNRDYIDNYVPATGQHTPVTKEDGSVVCSVCGTVISAAPTPTPDDSSSSSSSSSSSESTDSGSSSSSSSDGSDSSQTDSSDTNTEGDTPQA
ncbi:MAG TPA: SGNH/GDSL hydrolase family protein [Candidatus Gemmiger faecavium]|nr:SGNH/GDSL hydrolase family protein [Candidatus Gemmiger faecavium]